MKIKVRALLLVFIILIAALPFSVSAAAQTAVQVAVPNSGNIIVERILYNALSRMNYQMVSISSSMNDCINSVVSGDAAILAEQIGGFDEQYPNLVFVPVAIAQVQMEVYARDNSFYDIASWEDLDGLKVYYNKQQTYVANHVPESAIGLIVDANETELWEALEQKDADVVALANSNGMSSSIPKGIKRIAIIEKFQAYPYVHEDYAWLVPQLTQALREMQEDGTMENIQNGTQSDSTKYVLHISSYNAEIGWEREILDGIKEGLNLDGTISYFNFNLNSQQIKNKQLQWESMANDIRIAIIEKNPDVIIVSDNDSLEFARANYDRLFPGVPLVFCGINGYSADMVYGIETHVTGCTESISVSATLQEMLRLYPNVRNIYIVNDYSNSGRRWQYDIASQVEKLNLGVTVSYNENLSGEELFRTIEGFDQNTLVLMGLYYRDCNGTYIGEEALQEKLYQISKNPVFTLLDTNIGSGFLGGMVTSAWNQGVTAGEKARQVLDGDAVNAIPIIYASEAINEWVFDAEVAKEFKINMKDMPEGYRAVNRDIPVWEEHRAETVTALVVIGILLLVSIFLHVHLTGMKKEKRRLVSDNEEIGSKLAALRQEYSVQNILKHVEQFVRNAPLAFAIVVDDVVIEANERCRKEIGMEPGKAVRSFYKSPEIWDKVQAELTVQDSVSDEVILFGMKNGEVHRHRVNVSRVAYEEKEGYLLFAFDVEREEHQKEYIIRIQDDLQRMIDTLPTAMAIIDLTDSQLEYINKEFLAMYGYRTLEQGKQIDFMPLLNKFFACWQHETIIFEHETEYTVEHNIHMKIFADQIVFRNKNCVVLIGQDISAEKKRAEILARAAEKEKEANQMKSLFLANMSHEIRTPMNAIIGLSQLALFKEQNAENSDLFYKISSSAKNLLSIINDILDFSKIEAEKMDIVEDDFSLEETITNTFMVAAEVVEDRQVEILLDIQPNVPCFLYGDKTRLWQILKNILDNAVKYTSEGRIILSVSVADANKDGVVVEFGIKDTGVGMNPEQLSRLFMPFQQFNRNASKKAGTGLGMSITKQLVDLMHGTIEVKSELGEGTEFMITIPFGYAKDQMTLGTYTKQIVNKRAQRMGTVLLVDDDSSALFVMESLLKMAGIDSVSVNNTAQALQKVKEHADAGTPFQIVLIDYILGEENGIELATQINAVEENTKLLLVTAYLRRIISDSVLKEAKIVDVIEKPFVASSFLQKVCNVVPETERFSKENRLTFADARVLLCEDNDMNQMVASGLLGMFGITPVIANNGREALEILEKETFDLVLMDIVMPHMDGHEATIAVRQSNKPYKDVPIVAMTANVMQDEIAQCIKEGMNGHIDKPIDIDKFQTVLKKFLSEKRVYEN